MVAVLSAAKAERDFLRGLATGNATNATAQPLTMSGPTPPPQGTPNYYPNVSIPFTSTLGCGACLQSGYVFCIPGAEGSDPSTWGGKTPVCCQNATKCPQTSNSSYVCSNTYTDASLA